MTAIKKSVRLTSPTVKVCKSLSGPERINWSGSINKLSERYSKIVNENLPELNERQKQALVKIYNGRTYQRKNEEELEIKIMQWVVADANVSEILDDEEHKGLVKIVKSWTTTQRIAVLAMSEDFLLTIKN